MFRQKYDVVKGNVSADVRSTENDWKMTGNHLNIEFFRWLKEVQVS